MLSNPIHAGKTSWSHGETPTAKRRTSATASPSHAIQRGATRVRSRIVAVLIVKTPAIRRAYVRSRIDESCRPSAIVAVPRVAEGWAPMVCEQRPADRGRDEEHPDEEEPAAEEDRGEEAVLELSEPVTHDADEPEERDPSERHEGQRPRERLTAAAARQPRAGRPDPRRRRQREERERGDEQGGEHDPGDRSGPWGPQRLAELVCCGLGSHVPTSSRGARPPGVDDHPDGPRGVRRGVWKRRGRPARCPFRSPATGDQGTWA